MSVNKLCFAGVALVLLSGCTEVISFGAGFGAGFFTGQYYTKQEMEKSQASMASAMPPASAYPEQQAYTQPQPQNAPIPMGGYAQPPAYDYGVPPAPAYPQNYGGQNYGSAPTAYPTMPYDQGYYPPPAPVQAPAPVAPQGYYMVPVPTAPYDPYAAAQAQAQAAPPLPAPVVPAMPTQRYTPNS